MKRQQAVQLLVVAVSGALVGGYVVYRVMSGTAPPSAAPTGATAAATQPSGPGDPLKTDGPTPGDPTRLGGSKSLMMFTPTPDPPAPPPPSVMLPSSKSGPIIPAPVSPPPAPPKSLPPKPNQ